MGFVSVGKDDGIATITLARGKVNALNDDVVDELKCCFKACEDDARVRSIILTGQGRFFSFGFDIPEFLSFTKERFISYLLNFTGFYTYLFQYPKPVVASLNGHTIAGGCMISLACDYRLMATGKARISLNEIGFGSSVFAGSTEMLRFWTGSATATSMLYSGAMYSAQEALEMGLIHEVATEADMAVRAMEVAADFTRKHKDAFAAIKGLLRKQIADEMASREESSIREFADIWYSEDTWSQLKNIKIH